MKNNRGFTLIELMIAVAIIGILALVLIPRVAGIRTQAKLSGIDTNMRLAESVILSVLNDFDSSDDLTDLETAIINRLDVDNDDKDPKNPLFPSAMGADTVANFNDDDNVPEAAFVYTDGDETDLSAVTGATGTIATIGSGDLDFAGAILISSYVNNNSIEVLLTPYDDAGNVMTNKEKTITQ